MKTIENRGSWRSRIRLSMRGLMLLVLLIGVVLGYGARLRSLARTQRRAVDAIRKAGGVVLFTWQFEGEKFRPPTGGATVAGKVPGWPAWLVDRLGVEYFGDVREVYFGGGWASPGGPVPTAAEIDSALVFIGQLPQLRILSLVDTPASDAGLDLLRGQTGLRVLVLDGTRIGDAGLAKIAGLDHLEILKLDRTAVTDAGLAHVAGLTRLSRLSLYQVAGVTDRGLVHLQGLSRLKQLYLHGTNVTDAGVRELQAVSPRVEIDR
jgi:hypothetical protein